jgi:hypothetical protein
VRDTRRASNGRAQARSSSGADSQPAERTAAPGQGEGGLGPRWPGPADSIQQLVVCGSAWYLAEQTTRGIRLRRLRPEEVLPVPIRPLPRGDDIRLMVWIGYCVAALVVIAWILFG